MRFDGITMNDQLPAGHDDNALIAERRAQGFERCFERFASANRDLFEKEVLRRWYDDERLASPLARRVFVLPRPVLTEAQAASSHAEPHRP